MDVATGHGHETERRLCEVKLWRWGVEWSGVKWLFVDDKGVVW
jgi:hypothetical protein